ncbi:MAG: pentapeptide repeat-containing protein [Pseudanabaenaceae cyanobacterium]
MKLTVKVWLLWMATVATIAVVWGVETGDGSLVAVALLLGMGAIAPILLPATLAVWQQSPLGRHWEVTFAGILVLILLWAIGRRSQIDDAFWQWFNQLRWEAWGAVGQILIALLAVWVAWRQNQIAEQLTGQQNRITQQQTIDAYFQGVSDLIVDPQGQLEDWPLERAIVQARTAALLGSTDRDGRAQVLRFLSSANLLTPLKRDGLLGRPILDGSGGYQVDVEHGVRVVNLGSMLVGKDLGQTDLRFSDLSGANLTGAQLSGCHLTGVNLAATVLTRANLSGANLSGARLFYGTLEMASPWDESLTPDYESGRRTGAVVEGANFRRVQGLSPENRWYVCAWCGERSRRTVPGGCRDVPNLLGR